MSTNMRLGVGMACAALAWLCLLATLVAWGREVPWFTVSYNVPITVAFAALVSHMAMSAYGLDTRAAIRRYGPIGTVWLAGGLLLFLRLVTKSIDVSGHMSWAILMGAQCFIERLPGWFTLFVTAVGVHVLLLKLLVLGGNSGQYGVLAGCGLAAMLWAATRPTARLDGE
jgi:hypothetical protein